MPPLTTYRDQVCIITGASSGIGLAFAQALDQRGAKLVLFARRADRLEALGATLTGEYEIVVGDITQAADRQRLVDATLGHFGRVDVLINNAGQGGSNDPIYELKSSDIDNMLAVNLGGIIHLTQAVTRGMVERHTGLIINVSSPAGQIIVPNSYLYGVTKAGLSTFSKALQRSLWREGVHTLDFRPSFTRSEMVNPTHEARIPRVLDVKDASVVVERALDAALRGKKDLMTGNLIVRMGMWTERMLPRLADLILKRVQY